MTTAGFVSAFFTVVADLEVSPQDRMANPKGLKVFAVERYELPNVFVSCRALCDVQSSPLVFAPNRVFGCGPLQGKAPGGTLCLMSALSWAELLFVCLFFSH